MPPKDARSDLARQWLRKAGRDMRKADLAIGAPDALWDIAAFHSQQAAEKALKAFLAWQNLSRRSSSIVPT